MPAPRQPPGPSSFAAIRAIVLARVLDADFFTRVARAHPRIAYVHVGAERLYVLSHPDLARQLLIDAGRYSVKSRGLRGAQRILGDGLLTSEGDLHRQQRRLISPVFRHEKVVGYLDATARAVERTDEAWRAGGPDVDMAQEMSALTFEAVGLALFGADLRPEVGEVRAALADLLGAYNRSFRPWFDLELRLPTPLSRRVAAAKARLDGVVDRIIAGRAGAGGCEDLLDALLSTTDAAAGASAGPMSGAQLRDEVMTLMLAGHETTASALTFAWYLLARRPETLEWLREEIDAGDSVDRAHAVIAESMRLYPPAWLLGRRLTADLVIDGWTAPAGSTCLVSQWVLHRDPRFWDEPTAFRPQRWLTDEGAFDERAPGAPRYAYFPFGAGSRMCVGESFAWGEATLVLTRLARRWSPRLVPGFRLRLRPAITLRARDGMPMTLAAR